jgi:hypothetical protein
MSNRAYAWLTAIVAVVVVLLVLLLPHMSEIIAAWAVIRVVLITAATIATASGGYIYIWHPVHSRFLDSRAKSHEIKRANIELAHTHELNILKERLEHERQMIALRNHVLNAGQTLVNQEQEDWRIHAAPHKPLLPGGQPEAVVDAAVPIPQAPPFRMMSHLISEQRMPLCYIADNGASVPAFGTIDDLLSMAVTGKPGRGKTTALMYYVCMLLKCGAEVYVFDPHGAMNELAVLNTMPLPGMPRSARIVYVDRREDTVNMVPVLLGKLDERDELYRTRKQTLHPLLLLADELPVLADYDTQTAAEYKAINKARERAGQIALDVPLMIELIRRFVLEARKWRCFFIGSGQTFDADTLPTRVTDSLNSRIVFFSSDQRARMSGLENDVVKELLPVIRNAGPGVMVFDCSRWEKPMIGAIPVITMDDMMAFLGVPASLPGPAEIDEEMPVLQLRETFTGPLVNTGMSTPDKPVPMSPQRVPEESPVVSPGTSTGPTRTITGLLGPTDKRLTKDESRQFCTLYRQALLARGQANIKEVLKSMHKGNHYFKHASILAEQMRRQSSNVRGG